MHIIYRSFEKLFGLPCWNVTTDYGLTFKFGNPYLRIHEMKKTYKVDYVPIPIFSKKRHIIVKGQWFLWIYMAHWKALYKGKRIITNSSSNHNIRRFSNQIEGQRLIQVRVNENTGATSFLFDLDCTVEIRRWGKNSKDELWHLSKPNGYCLSIYGDGKYSHRPGSGIDRRPGVERRPIKF